MDLTMGADGHYSGTVTSGMGSGAANGTYSVQNGTLSMSVPAVAGAEGLPATFGGQIQLKMNALSPSMIRLSDGQHDFTMERTSF